MHLLLMSLCIGVVVMPREWLNWRLEVKWRGEAEAESAGYPAVDGNVKH